LQNGSLAALDPDIDSNHFRIRSFSSLVSNRRRWVWKMPPARQKNARINHAMTPGMVGLLVDLICN
jgi:hypothetical protein